MLVIGQGRIRTALWQLIEIRTPFALKSRNMTGATLSLVSIFLTFFSVHGRLP